MILPTKKALLSGLITLLFCFTAYAIKQSLDEDDWSIPIIPDNHTYEISVTHYENYDTYIKSYMNNETKDYIINEYTVYHDELKGPDVNSSSHDLSNDSTTPPHDHLSDFALESRRQEIQENQTIHNNSFPTAKSIIYELAIPKGAIVYPREMQGRTFDSTLILQKTHTIKDLITALHSPIIKARIARLKLTFQNSHIPRRGHTHRFKDELEYLDLLLSGRVIELLEQIMDPDLHVAESAFEELKQLWPWKREHTFLGQSLKNGTGESGFITETLGVNIMKIAEKALIIRQDYIAQYATAQEQKTIQEYREKCYLLQQQGNWNALFDQKQLLYRYINENDNKNELITHVCFAITENCCFDPITTVFRSIIREPSLEKACDHLKNLEKQIVIQAEQHGIIPMNDIRTWIINHYGFDVLDAAQNCYKSRPDYVYTPENQSYLSDTIKPILSNIESKNLQGAHAELVNLEKQIDKALEERNITDPIAQKEYNEKSAFRALLNYPAAS